MPNGDDMMDDLKFEGMIKEFDPTAKFLARQIREMKCDLEEMKSLPLLSRRQVAAGVGGIGGLSAVVTVVTDFLLKTLGK